MSQLEELFEKYVQRNITEAEEQQFFELIREDSYDPALLALIEGVLARPSALQEVAPEKADQILSLILSTTKRTAPLVRLWKRWRVPAAAVLLLVAGLSWFVLHRPHETERTEALSKPAPHTILPARSGAVLTLADGRTISLDSADSGVIAREGGATVTLKDNLLAYDAKGAGLVTYNTLSTPRGRLFDLVLPDGSRVWLNTESSLRFPTRFSGKDRVVELTGEAWFEIARNEKMPFVVKVGEGREVQVLGTGFNVNAYKNEGELKTTLLHGSVQVSTVTDKGIRYSRVLRPGEQSSQPFERNHTAIRVQPVDTAQVMAWKNGIFNFEGSGIETVMRQLERWYDIEVVFEKGVPDIKFAGKMGRDLTLQQVLRILEISKVHYQLKEDRKLIITP